jgi:hypothetical protein
MINWNYITKYKTKYVNKRHAVSYKDNADKTVNEMTELILKDLYHHYPYKTTNSQIKKSNNNHKALIKICVKLIDSFN